MKICYKRITYGALLVALFAIMLMPGILPGIDTGVVMASEAAAPADAVATADAAAATDAAAVAAYPPAPKLTAADYPTVGGFSSRMVVWIVAQLHLWFAAFVLAALSVIAGK